MNIYLAQFWQVFIYIIIRIGGLYKFIDLKG